MSNNEVSIPSLQSHKYLTTVSMDSDRFANSFIFYKSNIRVNVEMRWKLNLFNCVKELTIEGILTEKDLWRIGDENCLCIESTVVVQERTKKSTYSFFVFFDIFNEKKLYTKVIKDGVDVSSKAVNKKVDKISYS